MRSTDEFAYGVAGPHERRRALLAQTAAAAGPAVALLLQPNLGSDVPVALAATAAEATALLVVASICRNQYLASEMPAYGLLGLAFGFAGVLAAAATVGSGALVPLPDHLRLGPAAIAALYLACRCGFVAFVACYVLGEQLVRTRPNGRELAEGLHRRLHVAFPVLVATVLLLVFTTMRDVRAAIAIDPVVRIVLSLGALATLLALRRTTRLVKSADLWLSVGLTADVASLLTMPDDLGVSGRAAAVMVLEGTGASFLYLAVMLGHANDALVRITRRNRETASASVRDPLTELYNARGAKERSNEAIRYCRRANVSLALISIEIDDFRAYVEHYGRAAADRTLRSIAAALAGTALRPLDASARTGDDAFCLILPETDVQGALAVGTRVRDQIRRYAIAHAPGSGRDVVTVSMGIATAASAAAFLADRLAARAEGALYEAKQSGGDRVRLADVDEAELPAVLRVVI